MRAAVIFGLGSSEKNLKAFAKASDTNWQIGMPASSSEADAILIFGGDGTIHRHLPRLVELKLPVLVVPCGSGNDFARSLHLSSPRLSLRAWRQFSQGAAKVREIDLGVISSLGQDETRDLGISPTHQHYFCCVAGVGLDSEVARRANELPQWLRGRGGYAASLPGALLRFCSFQAKLSTASEQNPQGFVIYKEAPITLAAFANTPVYGGGMRIAPNARLDDGQLDLCVVNNIDKFKLFCLFPTVYFGRHLDMKEVEYTRASRLRIETEKPLDVYADGEYVCQTPVEISVASKSLVIVDSGS